MNDKCEWKDGFYNPCTELRDQGIIYSVNLGLSTVNGIDGDVIEIQYCPFCGAYIRKLLIVKSGDTWVAHWDGVDYLCIDPICACMADWEKDNDPPGDCFFTLQGISDTWKPFSEKGKFHDSEGTTYLEITDEIAKLRPMCCFSEGLRKYKGKLLHVRQVVNKFLSERIDLGYMGECRLATAKEIQEAQE